jgi:hypothetical protein
MFTSQGPNLYKSSDGFSVEVLGRTGLRYGEANRQMLVESEVLTGPYGMAVYKDTIQKWDPPCDNVPVTDSIRQTESRPLSGCPMGHSEKTRLAVKGRVCGFEVAIHLPRCIESTKILNQIRKTSAFCPKPRSPPAVPGTHFEKIE